MDSQLILSVVLPVYNEADSLPELLKEIKQAFTDKFGYEVIAVDDGSRDHSFSQLQSLKSELNLPLKIIRLQKNFGKAAALLAGFKIAQGKFVATLDADLQNDPADLVKMLEFLRSNPGTDLVCGWRKKRIDPRGKKVASHLANKVAALTTGVKIHDMNSGIKLMRSNVAKNLPLYGEMHRYIPALAESAGFKVGEIEVAHQARKYGQSKYNSTRLLAGFFDFLTVRFIDKYRQKPLHFFGRLGFLLFFVGFVILVYLTVLWFGGQGIGNRPLFMLGILLVIAGIQIFSLGFLAELWAYKSFQLSYIIKEIDSWDDQTKTE